MLNLTRCKFLATLVAFGFFGAGAAFAQTATTTEAPATPPADALPLGEVVSGIGSTYTAETHGVWEVRCVRTEAGNDPCQLYQLLKDEGGNSIAEISLFNLPDGQAAAAGATIITPLETLLTQSLRLQIDTGAVKTYPFTWCAPMGCIARVGFTVEEIAQFKAGSSASLIVVPVAAPDKEVVVTVSLTGFTAGYDAVVKANLATNAGAAPATTTP